MIFVFIGNGSDINPNNPMIINSKSKPTYLFVYLLCNYHIELDMSTPIASLSYEDIGDVMQPTINIFPESNDIDQDDFNFNDITSDDNVTCKRLVL